MSSLPAASRSDPSFNVSVPALPDGLFSYHDEDLDISVSWSPHPSLVTGIRQRVVEAVDRLPREWLAPPIEGELFDSAQDAEARLDGYSLVAGFQIVTGHGSTKIRRNFQCKHHGDRTRNDRGLEARVERDPKDKKIIVSNRKRDDTRVH
jgi:hypothetical protein